MDKQTGNRYGWYAVQGGVARHLWYKREDMDTCLSVCGEMATVHELVPDPDAPYCGRCRTLSAIGVRYGLLAEVS